jgi:hypothetical protein
MLRRGVSVLIAPIATSIASVSLFMLEALKPGKKAVHSRSRLISIWRHLRSRIHYVRAFVRPDVVLIEGCTENGRSVSILRSGVEDRRASYFFAGQILAELRAERALGRRWLWTLPALGREHGCTFVLIRVSSGRADLARRVLRCAADDAFYLPLFVGAVVDVTDRARLLHSRDLRDDIRRIRNRGFQFSISRSKQDLETFIRLYRDPYLAKVHGFDAVSMDLGPVLASCTNDELPEPWVLLKVELEGKWVAGDLLVSEVGRAALMELGVKDADTAYVRRGALQAAYWLSLEYLRGQGHKWVSLMHVRPFLRGGVLQYKLKFSPFLKPVALDGYLLLPDQEDDGAREILLREPFLAFKGDSLQAVWFSVDSAASPDRSCIPVDRLNIAGISGIERVALRSKRGVGG